MLSLSLLCKTFLADFDLIVGRELACIMWLYFVSIAVLCGDSLDSYCVGSLTCYIIDKLYTTEVLTHTRGGCANRHRGGASVVCSLSGLYYSYSLTTIYC